MKYAYYCPACKSFWQSESTSEANIQPCGTCGGAPLYTGYSAEYWKSLSQLEKDAVCARLTARAAANASVGGPAQKRVSGSTAWISFLRVLSWFIFISTIAAGGIIAYNASEYGFEGEGFLIVVASIVVAFSIVAGMMVFLGMAEDLRAIRHTFEGKK